MTVIQFVLTMSLAMNIALLALAWHLVLKIEHLAESHATDRAWGEES